MSLRQALLKKRGFMSSLHSIKKHLNELKFCPRPVGSFRGVTFNQDTATHKGVRAPIACGSWECEFCGPKNLKRLKARIYNGNISTDYVGAGGRYCQKFLTLTCPGVFYRSQNSPDQAYEEMQDNYHKLIRALKKRLGEFYCLRVNEKHKDGFPHFHILLCGQAIKSKLVKQYIDELWCEKYGMGYTWIEVIKHGLRAGVSYITKYLTKAATEGNRFARGKRLFTASAGALAKRYTSTTKWIAKRFISAGQAGCGYCALNVNQTLTESIIFSEESTMEKVDLLNRFVNRVLYSP